MVIPAVVNIVTRNRGRMGSFMTISFHRDESPKSGVGFLIFNSRLFLLTEWIFVGIITLGVMGFVTDRALRILAATLLKRYDVKL
jgi:NitT/TauT family transport system permease protein